ncbi:MAG: VOC family protein [Gammaproteobacteria bacterium]|nr:VOC family protein [Gammaproteobacteria bacterium]
MNKLTGLHHLAVCTSNIKAQIEFFTDVLGMELVALYWMHGVENTFHGFVRMNDESCIALVQNPQIGEVPVEVGVTHAGNPGGPSARGTMQHLAMRVDNEAELMAMRDRIRSREVPVMGPIDHGFCKSIYFAGPENLALELSYSDDAINAEAWIDPEVMELAGISPEELAHYKAPAEYTAQGGTLAQPALDGPGPHMTWNEGSGLAAALRMTDAEVSAAMDDTEPPVKVAL